MGSQAVLLEAALGGAMELALGGAMALVLGGVTVVESDEAMELASENVLETRWG